MFYSALADIVVILHLLFIVFVIAGGFIAMRWKRVIWIHIPVALWGIIVEWGNLICPLTPLENHFRKLAKLTTYNSSFIEEYIYPLIYLDFLNRHIQLVLGLFVIVINFIAYRLVIKKHNGK